MGPMRPTGLGLVTLTTLALSLASPGAAAPVMVLYDITGGSTRTRGPGLALRALVDRSRNGAFSTTGTRAYARATAGGQLTAGVFSTFYVYSGLRSLFRVSDLVGQEVSVPEPPRSGLLLASWLGVLDVAAAGARYSTRGT